MPHACAPFVFTWAVCVSLFLIILLLIKLMGLCRCHCTQASHCYFIMLLAHPRVLSTDPTAAVTIPPRLLFYTFFFAQTV